jgi:hypothetical protein
MINLHIDNTEWLLEYNTRDGLTPIFRVGDVVCANCKSLDFVFNSSGYPKCYDCGNDLTEQVKIN